MVAELSGCGKGGHAQSGTYVLTVTGINQSSARSINLRLTVDCRR